MIRRVLNSALFAAAILLANFSTHAADSQAINLPQLNAGDTWKFGITDLWKNARTSGETVTFRGVIDGLAHFDLLTEAGSTFKVIRTPERNVVSDRSGRWKPELPDLSFPLIVGKTWERDVEWTTPEGAVAAVRVKRRVAAFESVTVPAGTFDSVRIEGEASYAWQNRPSWSTTSDSSILWYAPAARNVVKREYRWQVGTRTQDRRLTQLESFTPGP